MELNEYLSESRKKRLRRRRKFVVALIVIGALIAIYAVLWFFLWSPVFRVDTIEVRGNTNVPTDAIVAMARSALVSDRHFLSFLGSRNMLAWSSALAADIPASDPQIAGAVLSKDYGAHAIVITVNEREPLAIWCFISPNSGIAPDVSSPPNGTVTASTTVTIAPVNNNESCYWFDQSGTLFASTFDTEGDLLSAVHDYSQTDPGLGKTALSDRFMPNLIAMLGVLQASGLRINEIRLNDIGLEEIQVTTYNGPSIYFSLRFPVDANTLAALRSVMNKSSFDNLQYVDFRTQGRMYYE